MATKTHQNPTVSKIKNDKIVLIAGIIGGISLFLLVCLVAGFLVFGWFTWPESESTTLQEPPSQQLVMGTEVAGDTLAVIARMDAGQGMLNVYVFNLDDSVLHLPEGTYYAELLGADGSIHSFESIHIRPSANYWTPVNFSTYESKQFTDQHIVEQLKTLAEFLLDVEYIRLTYYEIITNNYAYPFYDPAVIVSWEDVDVLMQSFNNLGDRDQTLNAAEAFFSRAAASSASGQGQFALARPSIDESAEVGIIKSILNFFGIYDKEKEQATADLVTGITNLVEPEAKQEVLSALNEIEGINVGDLDEFIRILNSGLIKDPVQVRSYLLRTEGGYFAGTLQSVKGSNRPELEDIHRIGGELVKQGAELNIKTIKYVLEQTFPGISKGFDYAEKIDKFAEFVRNLYNDPAGTLGAALLTAAEDAIKDAIKNQITNQFLDTFPEMTQEDAESMADNIMDHVDGVKNGLLELAAEIDPATAPGMAADPDVEIETERIVDEYGTEVIYIHTNGAHCGESESGYTYRWAVDIAHYVHTKDVQGVVKFHACPGGGRVLYRLVGEVNPDGTFRLLGEKKDGGGDLLKDALDFVNFFFDPKTGIISPNFTP